ITARTARSRSGSAWSRGTRYGIRASLILRLARTRRWAMAGSAIRKARATSSVRSPPSSRRVSAIWASGASAGWQHVKISRSRSSGTGPTSCAPARSGSTSAARSWSSSRPRASRRSRSIAHRRAVVVIQPPGLGGRPSRGQRRSANPNASWTASSAISICPKTRIRAATDRPDSSRKTRPIVASPTAAGATPARSTPAPPVPVPPPPGGSLIRSGSACVPERADLDRHADDGARLGRPAQGGIKIVSLDDVEAGQVLLRLHERTVRRHGLPCRHPHHGGHVRPGQATGEQPGPGRLHLLLQDLHVLGRLPHLLRRHRLGPLRAAVGAGVYGQHVLGHRNAPRPGGHLPPTPHYERPSAKSTAKARKPVRAPR